MSVDILCVDILCVDIPSAHQILFCYILAAILTQTDFCLLLSIFISKATCTSVMITSVTIKKVRRYLHTFPFSANSSTTKLIYLASVNHDKKEPSSFFCCQNSQNGGGFASTYPPSTIKLFIKLFYANETISSMTFRY